MIVLSDRSLYNAGLLFHTQHTKASAECHPLDALNFEIRCKRAVMATRHSRSKDKTLFDSHSRPTGKHCYLFVRTDNETLSVAMRIGNQDFSLKIAVTKPSLKQAE